MKPEGSLLADILRLVLAGIVALFLRDAARVVKKRLKLGKPRDLAEAHWTWKDSGSYLLWKAVIVPFAPLALWGITGCPWFACISVLWLTSDRGVMDRGFFG